MLYVQDDAAEAEWFSVSKPPQPLAFDHKLILRRAFQHLAQQKEAKEAGTDQNFMLCIMVLIPAEFQICLMPKGQPGSGEALKAPLP